MMQTTVLSVEANKILASKHKEMHQNKAIFSRYEKIFKQPHNPKQRGNGEQPSWSPNEAYMLSLEWLWEPVDALLANHSLAINFPLRELFQTSVEFLDTADDHRRLFYGQLINLDNNRAITGFTLNVPHSHATFMYPKPVTIHIAATLSE